jgi:hypothetical protein
LLASTPKFYLRFVPASSSWLNLVERFFREITGKVIRRGSFSSLPELITAIEESIVAHNDDPQPFVWTKTAGEILEKVRRARVALDEVRAASVKT